jgi:hypothetical protein
MENYIVFFLYVESLYSIQSFVKSKENLVSNKFWTLPLISINPYPSPLIFDQGNAWGKQAAKKLKAFF